VTLTSGFIQTTVRIQAVKIATGHNADDIAETVLMNILRGDIARLQRCTTIVTGADGALPRVKPLKYAYEKEIVMYAHFKKLDYFSTEQVDILLQNCDCWSIGSIGSIGSSRSVGFIGPMGSLGSTGSVSLLGSLGPLGLLGQLSLLGLLGDPLEKLTQPNDTLQPSYFAF
jgi:hypothetical protein